MRFWVLPRIWKKDKASYISFFQQLHDRDLDEIKLVVDDKCLGIWETILDKGIMPSEKVLDFPVDYNTLTDSVNL